MKLTVSLSLRFLSLVCLIPLIALASDLIKNLDPYSLLLYFPLLAVLAVVILGIIGAVYLAKQETSLSALLFVVLTLISLLFCLYASFGITFTSIAYGIVCGIAIVSLLCSNLPFSAVYLTTVSKENRSLRVTAIVYGVLSILVFGQYLLRSLFGEGNDIANSVQEIPAYLSMEVFYSLCGILLVVGIVLITLVWREVQKSMEY